MLQSKDIYWNEKMDDYITNYNSLINKDDKEKLFNEYLYKPFSKLVEYVVNTWKWDYIRESKEDIQQDLLGFILYKIKHYDITKGKSFSYFTIVLKNYLINTNNENYKEYKLRYENDDDIIYNNENDDNLIVNIIDGGKEKYDNKVFYKEYVKQIIEYFEDNFDEIFVQEKHKIIGKIMIDMLSNPDDFDLKSCKKIDVVDELSKISNLPIKCVYNAYSHIKLKKLNTLYKKIKYELLGVSIVNKGYLTPIQKRNSKRYFSNREFYKKRNLDQYYRKKNEKSILG